ncbi:MAG: ABC transporter ATP-binding protein [Acidobacteria bacterium]|nr:ABC transporter ATP-binding protein [Acidobacteriota bacterium]
MNEAGQPLEGQADGTAERPDALLSARRLTKTYGAGATRIEVLRDLSLDVTAGEMIAILGASGSGKSTLLHLLGGLDRPTDGSVRFCGFDIFSAAGVDLPRFRSRIVGFMFQYHHLLPEFTALENIMMPALIDGWDRATAQTRAGEMLRMVSLPGRSDHRPAELSGGEQQRVALARALCRSPRVLLADEPTGNLDARTGEQVFSLLHELHASTGLTSVIVTHNDRLAARCDRRLHLEDGKLR